MCLWHQWFHRQKEGIWDDLKSYFIILSSQKSLPKNALFCSAHCCPHSESLSNSQNRTFWDSKCFGWMWQAQVAPPAASNLALTGTATSLGLLHTLCQQREVWGNRSQQEKTVRESRGWCGREGMIFLRNRLIEVVTCVPSSAKRVKRICGQRRSRQDKKVSTIDDMSADKISRMLQMPLPSEKLRALPCPGR